MYCIHLHCLAVSCAQEQWESELSTRDGYFPPEKTLRRSLKRQTIQRVLRRANSCNSVILFGPSLDPFPYLKYPYDISVERTSVNLHIFIPSSACQSRDESFRRIISNKYRTVARREGISFLRSRYAFRSPRRRKRNTIIRPLNGDDLITMRESVGGRY